MVKNFQYFHSYTGHDEVVNMVVKIKTLQDNLRMMVTAIYKGHYPRALLGTGVCN